MVQSGSNVLADKVGARRHGVAVYAKGTYGDNLRLYVDGVDVTTLGSVCNASTEMSCFRTRRSISAVVAVRQRFWEKWIL